MGLSRSKNRYKTYKPIGVNRFRYLCISVYVQGRATCNRTALPYRSAEIVDNFEASSPACGYDVTRWTTLCITSHHLWISAIAAGPALSSTTGHATQGKGPQTPYSYPAAIGLTIAPKARPGGSGRLNAFCGVLCIRPGLPITDASIARRSST